MNAVRRPGIAGAMLALGIVTLGAPPPATARASKMVVAVLYFDNNTNNHDYDVLQKGLADMLVTDLSGVDVLEVVERERLQELLDEMSLQRTKYFDTKTAQKLGQGVGAQYVITGSFASFAPKMRIDIRLIEVASAKVVMADKVVGDAKEFFGLQEQLVARFVKGLSVTEAVEPSKGVGDLNNLLEYSRALDKADKGDLEGASKQLAQVVRAAPQFAMARTRYAEYVRRLRTAGKRRESALDRAEREMTESIDRVLAVEVGSFGERDRHEMNRYLGYRILRGQHLTWKLQKLVKPENADRWEGWAPRANRAEAAKLLRAYYDNTTTLIKEMETLRTIAKRGRFDSRIDTDDRQRARDLDIEDAGDWRALTPFRVRVDLAKLLLVGQTPWLAGDSFVYRPTLIETERRYERKAFALLDGAAVEIRDHLEERDKPNAHGEMIEVRAEGLVQLGRAEEAIAYWQEYLDKYPKGNKFEAFELKIEEILGLSPKAEQFRTMLPTCDRNMSGLIFEEVERVHRAQGNKGVDELAAAVQKACKGNQLGPTMLSQVYFFAARVAVLNGDCKRLEMLRKKAAATHPAFGTMMDDLAKSCE